MFRELKVRDGKRAANSKNTYFFEGKTAGGWFGKNLDLSMQIRVG